MSELISPGVSMSEQDYSEYSTSSSNCIVACIGEAQRGPVGVPTLITSQKELLQVFGKPKEGCYGIHSALQILTETSSLYYTRVVRSATNAKAGEEGIDKVLYQSLLGGSDNNGIQIIQTVNDDGTKVTVEIKDKSGERLEIFEDLSTDSNDPDYVGSEISTSSKYVRALSQRSGTIESKSFTLSGGNDTGSYSRAGVRGKDKLLFKSRYFDSTLNGGYVVISDPDMHGYFNVVVYDSNKSELLNLKSLSLDKDDSRYIGYIINSYSSSVVDVEVDESEDIVLEGDSLVFTGGDDGIDGISDEDIIGLSDGTGIHSVDNEEILRVDVLVVPGQTSVSVIHAALEVCESRGNTVFIADSPFGMTPKQVVDWSNGEGEYKNSLVPFDSSYGALYWPWVQYADPYSRSNIWLPPSGFVAARYAYTDKAAFPWKAPSGISRGKIKNALGIEMSPTKGERDLLQGNRNIINPIVYFQAEGLVIWGQKTMQRRPTALDRVNVRRTLTYLKTNIGDVTRFIVFEDNDPETTGEEWSNKAVAILDYVKSNGGLYDYVISINPTDEDINNNTLPIDVGVRPMKTAEYIPLRYNIMSYESGSSDDSDIE